MTLLLAVQVAAYLVLAARIEDYARRAATKARTGGAAAYRDVAEVAAGGKGRWS